MTPVEERNVACFQRFIEEGLNQKKCASIVDDIVAQNLIMEAPTVPMIDGRLNGVAIFRVFTDAFLNAFPDVQCTLPYLIAEGDIVAADIAYEGTHRAEFAGVPATNRYIKAGELWYMHFANGKIRNLRICEYGTPLLALLKGAD